MNYNDLELGRILFCVESWLVFVELCQRRLTKTVSSRCESVFRMLISLALCVSDACSSLLLLQCESFDSVIITAQTLLHYTQRT